MRRFAFCCLAALVLLVGCKKDVSGTYLLYDQGGVCWLQLVRTPDNHLTGQLITSLLKTDGEIERRSMALTGAVDGENVSLTGGGLFGLSPTTFSGTIEGDTLTLTGVQSTPITLKSFTCGLPNPSSSAEQSSASHSQGESGRCDKGKNLPGAKELPRRDRPTH